MGNYRFLRIGTVVPEEWTSATNPATLSERRRYVAGDSVLKHASCGCDPASFRGLLW